MKACVVVLVMVLCVCTGALGVQVNVGNGTFPLEAVKQLRELMEETRVCAHPLLPQVFVPVCQGTGAGQVFSTLAAVPLDVCEICSFAACTGC